MDYEAKLKIYHSHKKLFSEHFYPAYAEYSPNPSFGSLSKMNSDKRNLL